MRYQASGAITGVKYDFYTNTTEMTIQISGNVANECAQFRDKKVDIDVKVHREKRSAQANKLCWAAISELANAMRTSKDEVYLLMLRRYGQSFIMKVRRKDERWLKETYKYCELHEAWEVDGNARYWRVYIGTSLYNTEEMSIFIDGILSELAELGIPFADQATIEEAKRTWQNPKASSQTNGAGA